MSDESVLKISSETGQEYFSAFRGTLILPGSKDIRIEFKSVSDIISFSRSLEVVYGYWDSITCDDNGELVVDFEKPGMKLVVKHAKFLHIPKSLEDSELTNKISEKWNKKIEKLNNDT